MASLHPGAHLSKGNELPVTHTGYLKKLGQKHKNWKRRYIVVELGRLTYFEKSNGTADPPYGITQKGVVTLNGYEVQDGPGEHTLLLRHKTEKRELLVQAEEGEKEAENWRAILQHHVHFCNENPSLVLQDGASFQEDEAKRAAAALKFRTAADAAGDIEDDDDDKAAGFSAPKPIQLNPGFVIKSKRMNGLKVFFNVCDHEDIPQSDKKRGHKRWPIFVISPSCKVSVDKNADECHVLDICVHPSVMEECQQDTTGEAKEEVCLKIMEAVILREKKDKAAEASAVSMIDKSVFSFPRLAKKYKGDSVPSFLVPRNMHKMKKTTSVFTAIDLNDHVADLDKLLKEEEVIQSAKKELIEDSQLKGPSGAPKRCIPMRITRPTGAVVRVEPVKTAARVKHLLQHAHTLCYGRRVAADGSCWYRLLEGGWTPALTDGGQRMLKPVYPVQTPTTAALTGFNMVEAQEKGFFFDKTVKKLTFSVRLDYRALSPEETDSVLLLQRSYQDFLGLRNDLKEENNLQLDKVFPDYGSQALLAEHVSVDVLLELMEDVSQWLQRTLQGAAGTSATVKQFFEPSEVDCQKMDVDLSAAGGLGGAWPVAYK